MSQSAYKKLKQPTGAPPPSFLDLLSRLRSSSSYLVQLLSSSTSNSSSEVLVEISTLSSRVAAFSQSAKRADDQEKARATGWEDEVDAAGTILWNKSTALRHECEDGDPVDGRQKMKVVAELRRVAYRLIELGTLTPITPESRLSLLTLTTKTAESFVAAEQTSAADELLRDASSHAAELQGISSIDPSFAKERAKGLLAHYCSRIRTSMASDVPAVASWVREKALDLIKTEKLAWREVSKLAHAAYVVGVQQLRTCRDGFDVETDEWELAMHWLQVSLELLETGSGKEVQAMQLTTLKALAEAYVDGSRWSKAEETLKQILDLEPSPSLRRRQIKLVLARKGGDGEIVQAFVAALRSVDSDAEDSLRLLALVSKIPEERRILRFTVLQTLCASFTNTPMPAAATRNLLDQVFATAIFFVSDSDTARLSALLASASEASPKSPLSPSTAFLCITYIWRQGDKAHQDHRYVEAADWFLLAAHALFSSIDAVVFSKSIRKAALALVEAKENLRAEQILQLPAAGVDFAKTHFVRFYNYSLLHNTTKASAALQAMVTAPDFSLNQLLWAAKTANDANNKELLAQVLGTIVEICQKGGDVAGVELVVAIRCLIRLHISRVNEANETQSEEPALVLHSYLRVALDLVKSLANSPSIPDTLSKDVAWLYKTSFNLCVRFSAKWSADTLVSFYDLTAALIDVECKLDASVDAAILGKLWICKFAALSGRVDKTRTSEGAEKVRLHQALAIEAQSFIDELDANVERYSGLDKADALLAAAYGVLIESYTAAEEWSKLSALVENLENSKRPLPVSILKLATDEATSSSSCPRNELCSILRKTLVLLYSRQDLDVSSMALWLRMIVSALLEREPDEAFQYVQNAAHFASENSREYPSEEIHWLLSTSWDYGIEAYSAGSADVGKQWCDAAERFAEVLGDGGLVKKLSEWHGSIRERYEIAEDERMV